MKLFAALALATLVVTPALAQDPPARHHRARHVQTAPATTHFGRTESVSRHSTNPAYDVYQSNGFYVGSDPDPAIRRELERDHSSTPE